MRHLDDLYIPDHLEDYRKILGALLDVNNLVSNPVLPSNYSSVLQKWREAWCDLRDSREISEREGLGPQGPSRPAGGLRPPLPPPPPKKIPKKIKDGHHGPKMAASNRYGSN